MQVRQVNWQPYLFLPTLWLFTHTNKYKLVKLTRIIKITSEAGFVANTAWGTTEFILRAPFGILNFFFTFRQFPRKLVERKVFLWIAEEAWNKEFAQLVLLWCSSTANLYNDWWSKLFPKVLLIFLDDN